jgi:prolyl oligopeptidase
MAQNTVHSDIMKPPLARRDPVTENLHGREIIDPYRWLENASDGETQRFVEQQNAYTQSVLEKLSAKESLPGKEEVSHEEKLSGKEGLLGEEGLSGKEQLPGREKLHGEESLSGEEQLSGREKLRQKIEQFLTIGRVTSPRIADGKYFYERRDGRQNQPVVYVRVYKPAHRRSNEVKHEGPYETAHERSNEVKHEGPNETAHGAFRDGAFAEQAFAEQAFTERTFTESSLIDVNALAPDGTIALDWWYPSKDGRYVAFGVSANGSEISTLQVMNVESGGLLPEKIERARAASVAWLPDSSGFYYTRYPRPGDVPAGEEMYNRRVFFHALGKSVAADGTVAAEPDNGQSAGQAAEPDNGQSAGQAAEPDNRQSAGQAAEPDNRQSAGQAAEPADGQNDQLVFPPAGAAVDPQHWPDVTLSHDGRWLLVEVSQGWAKSELYLKDLSGAAGDFQRITEAGVNKAGIGQADFIYHAAILDGQLYIATNEDAPRFRVFKADCAAPQRQNWREIIPESEGVIEGHAILGRKLFVHYARNASSQLSIFDPEGSLAAEVPMPALGSIFDLGGGWNSDRGFFGFISYTVPPTIYEVSLAGVTKKWASMESGIDPEQYQIEQRWFNSKDGTRVPMFVVSRKGLARNGKNPALLSGYGGFNVGRTPFFNRNGMLLLLEHGGVYVDVQLRGGNEFGEEWHRGGMLAQKQNVFDDFIAAAEFLVAEKYTDAEHLAIQGGSNGGLLMGAALTQRPELFRAVVCQVPLLDMLRYHQFQIAKLWIPEYGSADDPNQFEYLQAYSPYHHVKPGTLYPAILFMTAESDTRVDPMHALKMAARLQAEAANGPDRPILLRVDSKAGHGVGKPIAKLVDDAVDVWSFLFSQLGISSQ